MTDGLPKLDRAKLRERLLVEFERVVREVADAVGIRTTGIRTTAASATLLSRLQRPRRRQC